MELEEEFEVKRQALELMKGRTMQELEELKDKAMKAAHKSDEDLDKALFRTQEQMKALVNAVTGEDSKQQAALGNLEAEVEKALQAGEVALQQFEDMKTSRQAEFQALRRAIDDASFDVDDHLTTAKRDLRQTKDVMLDYIKRETKMRVEKFEELSVSVRSEYRGPR